MRINLLIALILFLFSCSDTTDLDEEGQLQYDIIVPDDYDIIPEALNAVNENNSIYVKPDTYVENITLPATNGIKLIGSGEADCIIDGDSLASVIRFPEDLGGIIDITTVISGFTIQNGNVLS